EDINYYHVPTPFTELLYKSAFEQGQLLDAFFTVNTTPQFNFSIAYKGLRSLGKYQHILTSTGNFRFTSSYKSKNDKYQAHAHIVMQDLFNEENGGLQNASVPFFESGDEEFKDRGVLDVNFENADNILIGKRFYLKQQYNIIQKDSLSSNALSLQHTVWFEDKYYQYNQTRASDYFGEAFRATNLKDKVTLEHFYNQFQLNYSNKDLGELAFRVNHNNYNYGYNSITILDTNTIPNRLKRNILSIGGSYRKELGRLNIEGTFGLNVAGDFEGNFITGKAFYDITDELRFGAQINHSSTAPNYNTLLYQSNYIGYNWKNNFSNVQIQNIVFSLQAKNIGSISAELSNINNYTYFSRNQDSIIAPFQ